MSGDTYAMIRESRRRLGDLAARYEIEETRKAAERASEPGCEIMVGRVQCGAPVAFHLVGFRAAPRRIRHCTYHAIRNGERLDREGLDGRFVYAEKHRGR